jgi:heme/copper-type cytochrome/quinol oxidase subunit 2
MFIPLFSIIKVFVLSMDVIHSFGIYSFGIKIDAYVVARMWSLMRYVL